MACGYDRMEIIAKLNMSSDIDAVLKYAEENFSDDEKLTV